MKRRPIIPVIICLGFFAASSLWLALTLYLNNSSPNMNDSLFVPVSIKDVDTEDDIEVLIHRIGVMPHSSDGSDPVTITLNDIEIGWIVNQYNGNCRIVFDASDCSLPGLSDDDRYYYADPVPRERLRVTDIFAMPKDDPIDTLAESYEVCLYPDTVSATVHNYLTLRHPILLYAAANLAVITFTTAIGFGVSRARKAREL